MVPAVSLDASVGITASSSRPVSEDDGVAQAVRSREASTCQSTCQSTCMGPGACPCPPVPFPSFLSPSLPSCIFKPSVRLQGGSWCLHQAAELTTLVLQENVLPTELPCQGLGANFAVSASCQGADIWVPRTPDRGAGVALCGQKEPDSCELFNILLYLQVCGCSFAGLHV